MKLLPKARIAAAKATSSKRVPDFEIIRMLTSRFQDEMEKFLIIDTII
jgi:hypothetical protein